jgi:SAM-dependent methyltransferase
VKPADYYDVFSRTYDDRRDGPYHRMVDDMEAAIARRFIGDGCVLEVGCGTGRILDRLEGRRCFGIDPSRQMLRKARARGHTVVRGAAEALPFADGAFETTVSFKVLPHVPRLAAALRELHRVTRGTLVLEFYNPLSLRALAKRLRPQSIAADVDETDVPTAYHTLRRARAVVGSPVMGEWGIRIVTPAAALMRLPLAGPLLRLAERLLWRTPLRHVAGFIVLAARSRGRGSSPLA